MFVRKIWTSDRSIMALSGAALGALCVMALLGGSARRAAAKPEYALKENKTCQYCHKSPTPGAVDPRTGITETTERNPRGQYYAAHDHSFAGYNELTVMGKDAPPVFHLAWKEELTDPARRAAVADVVGDGKARLVTLSESSDQKGSATLAVRKWDGQAFVTEFTASAQGPADKLAVGKFAGANRPAVIVTAGDLWYWNGKQFAHKPAAQPLALLGATRLRSGEERVLLSEGTNAAKAYRVDPAAEHWLTEGIDAPPSSQVAWGDMHGTPEFFTQMGLSEAIGAGGLIGLWDVRNFGALFLYYAKIAQDFDTQPDPKDPNKTEFVIKSRSYYIAFHNARDPKGVELWGTPKLDGPVYDVGLLDAKGSGKTGLLVLTGNAADSKRRSLYFFALD